MADKNPVEKFNELIQLGYIIPSQDDPADFGEAAEYLAPITTLAFETPEVPLWNEELGGANAELGGGAQRDKKRKTRSSRR